MLDHHFQTYPTNKRSPSCMSGSQRHPCSQKRISNDRRNYKLISLTSVICNILKKIIKADVLTLLVGIGLKKHNMALYLPNKECTTNLLESMDTITKLLDEKNGFDIIFLNFAKALDILNHQYLIKELANY